MHSQYKNTFSNLIDDIWNIGNFLHNSFQYLKLLVNHTECCISRSTFSAHVLLLNMLRVQFENHLNSKHFFSLEMSASKYLGIRYGQQVYKWNNMNMNIWLFLLVIEIFYVIFFGNQRFIISNMDTSGLFVTKNKIKFTW